MKDQYDENIAASYSRSKLLPFRTCIERATIFDLLGSDLSGLAILDLGCGDGIWSVEMAKRGAKRVVGVDLSPEMVALAGERAGRAMVEQITSFCVGDASTLGALDGENGQFDLVLGCYLLNYATSRDVLLAMLRPVRANLKTGSRFVGFNDDPRDLLENYNTYEKYGLAKRWVAVGDRKTDSSSDNDPRQPGDEVIYSILSSPPLPGEGPKPHMFDITNYYMPPKVMEACFEEAGFRDFRFVRPSVDEAESKRLGIAVEKWDEMVGKNGNAGPLVGFEAFAV